MIYDDYFKNIEKLTETQRMVKKRDSIFPSKRRRITQI